MAFKILITEGRSPLGCGLLKVFEDQEHSIFCPVLSLHEWCDEDRVKSLLQEYQPAVLINTLQLSSPRPLEAQSYYSVLAKVCLQLSIPVIHLSSHEVFSPSQQNGSAMPEDKLPEPDSELACSLLAAEQAFLVNQRCIVLRLPWVVDLPGGVLEQVLKHLIYKKGADEGIQASGDWRGCMVSLADVVRVISAVTQQILCDSNVWGVAHMRNSDTCSELEFVDLVQRLLVKKGCETASVHLVARDRRFIASNGWLSGDKCSNGFGVQFCSWRQGIKAKVESWVDTEVSAGRLGS